MMTDSGQQDRGDKLFSQEQWESQFRSESFILLGAFRCRPSWSRRKGGNLAYELVLIIQNKWVQVLLPLLPSLSTGKMIFLPGEGFLIHTQRRRGGLTILKATFRGGGMVSNLQSELGITWELASPNNNNSYSVPLQDTMEATGYEQRHIHTLSFLNCILIFIYFWHAESSAEVQWLL